MELRKKVNRIKAAVGNFPSILSSVVLGDSLCPVLQMSLPGAKWLRHHLDCLQSPLGHRGGIASGPLESGWVMSSVPETIAFYMYSF